MSPEPHLVESRADHPPALALFAIQERELMQRYGSDTTGPRPAADDPVLLLYLGAEALGCVAVSHDGEIGEIKRMFVEKSARGRGLSRILLAGAEDLARRLGVETLRLETGTEQPEAMNLYAGSGYTPIPGYGYWKDSPSTRCFEKRLVPENASPST
ncbi:GNAT family N-acetyltransferase [Salinibacterium sp. dk2585]|uniref:GNAT family N-acetyltransferase n=1 Tax=unclassified Salinibacterium TaxID=2632331 RepID=UPI0011C24D4E|nr:MULTISPECIES: GNAT family N-acetyltransferase [unclassified Salinibacterium]QEE61014.1 GNAT family N-acetyltransferase [Salinibacterium sp. dk2585]TXK52956.1 GNAT family N-acetyltransferase [Salinibacterium sp. dk5596]